MRTCTVRTPISITDLQWILLLTHVKQENTMNGYHSTSTLGKSSFCHQRPDLLPKFHGRLCRSIGERSCSGSGSVHILGRCRFWWARADMATSISAPLHLHQQLYRRYGLYIGAWGMTVSEPGGHRGDVK